MDNFERINKEAWEKYLSHISVDCVLFGFNEGKIGVLLLKSTRRQKWMLPGGFVKNNEDVFDAAHRALKERSGAEHIFLEQFQVFGEHLRNKDEYDDVPRSAWIRQRFVSLGFWALVKYEDVTPKPDELADACQWWSLEDLPEIALDHQRIIDAALDSLRMHLNYKPVGFNLLPEEFTLPDMQKLYEAVLGKKLHRSNFARKMLSYKILKKLEPRKGVPGKPANLFAFDLKRYNDALKGGLEKIW